jgi:putative copper export protein/mono/diheme cytochrome c family protein
MSDLLPLLRGAHLLFLALLLGTATVRCVIAPRLAAADAALARLGRASLLLSVLTLLVWLLAQTATLAGATSPAAVAAALPTVIETTHFGHVAAIRLVLLAGAWATERRMFARWTVIFAAAALAVQAGTGHAGAIGGTTGLAMQAAEALHVIAAGAWLGGLLPLLVLVLRQPAEEAERAARRFAWIGGPAILALAATAIAQGWILAGGMPGLFGTAYGHLVLLKLALFAGLAILALANHRLLTPRLTSDGRARSLLIGSVAIETALGIAVLFAAASLASQVPGAHAQPVWPFQLRPSTAALEDPDIRREAMLALAGCLGAVLLLAAGTVWRRTRLTLLSAGTALAALSVPHLRPLLVEAYPTSFYRSASGFTAASIVRGAAVFAANCARCHGVSGRGDGPSAASLAVPPADLTASHLWEHSDGELFWWLTHGMDSPDGSGLAMPGFAAALNEDDRWAAIDFIRANNAGLALRESGTWPIPLAAPSLPLICAGSRETDMEGLRGRSVRIVAEPPPPQPIGNAATTVVLAASETPAPTGPDCVAATPDAWPAYAILTGTAAGSFPGTTVLVDAAGWLRAAFRADAGTALTAQLLTEIAREPLAATTGDANAHHH